MQILFLCTHNACRSILAEAIFNALAGEQISASSAGSHPADNVHPDTLNQLQQRNYAIDGLSTLSMDVAAAAPPDVVVTVCDKAADEACPVWLDNTPRVHWGLPDPTHPIDNGQTTEQLFDEVIAELEKRALALAMSDIPLDAATLADQLTALGSQ